MSDVGTLSSAIDWLREHQDAGRSVPSRLHDNATEGELGAPPFSPAFMAYLQGRPDDVILVRLSVACDHLHDATWPGCSVEREYYRAPMWRAMRRISGRMPRIRPSNPKPLALVVSVMDAGYDWRTASDRLRLNRELGEALILMAIRELYGQYALGPVGKRVPYTELSESQRMAEQAAVVGGKVATSAA